jgi:putative ABC transport system permease protein
MNLVRTGLTLLGIVFGVASVIAMITIGEGAQKKILDNIKTMGARLVHITANKVEGAHVSQLVQDSRGLGNADIRALRAVLPLQGREVGYLAKAGVKTTNLAAQVSDLNLFAVSRNFAHVAELRLVAGRDFSDFDFSAAAPVALVSRENAVAFWGSEAGAVGQQVSFNYKWFQIVGVYDRFGLVSSKGRRKKQGGVDVSEYARSFLVPITMYHEKLHPPKVYGEYDRLLIRCRDLLETNAVKDIAGRVLDLTHNHRADYRIVSPQELLEQQQATQQIFNIVLLSIASISLLVGGIGIMNIMLANVLERRTEIGLRRALGAKKRDIVLQFLLESVLICLIGGVAGICVGIGISVAILHWTAIPVSFSLFPMALSFAISFAIGVIFGLFPAWKAAGLNPVEALHHE